MSTQNPDTPKISFDDKLKSIRHGLRDGDRFFHKAADRLKLMYMDSRPDSNIRFCHNTNNQRLLRFLLLSTATTGSAAVGISDILQRTNLDDIAYRRELLYLEKTVSCPAENPTSKEVSDITTDPARHLQVPDIPPLITRHTRPRRSDNNRLPDDIPLSPPTRETPAADVDNLSRSRHCGRQARRAG